MNVSNIRWVRLGDYIERSMENNSDLKYGPELIEGVNSDGVFCESRANTIDINLKPYKIVNNGDFVYNPSRLNLGSLAYRTTGMCIVSHLYVVFRLNELGKRYFLPDFLYMYFKRNEFLRLVTFLNLGSQRPEFNFYDMSEIRVPMPTLDIQHEVVATYNGLKSLAEQNEALIKPISNACEALVTNCKQTYRCKSIGDFIEIKDQKNRENLDYEIYGINKEKTFMPTHADTNELDKSKYKIVSKDDFVFSGMQTGRDICIRLALYNDTTPIIVSPAYTTFRVTNPAILPKYLFLHFKRQEMDRFGWFLSDGSVRSNLDWDRFCEIQIPIPPLEIQESIVNLYNCLEEAKEIASEAREQLKMLCPALVQKAANS